MPTHTPACTHASIQGKNNYKQSQNEPCWNGKHKRKVQIKSGDGKKLLQSLEYNMQIGSIYEAYRRLKTVPDQSQQQIQEKFKFLFLFTPLLTQAFLKHALTRKKLS